MICLTLTEKTMAENNVLLEQNKDLIDLVEIRFDFLNRSVLENMRKIRDSLSVPAIATFRRISDGGKYHGDENYRIKKLTEAVEAGFDYVDIECDIDASELMKRAGERKSRVISSFHSFSGVPDSLKEMIQKMSADRNVIPKVAVYPKNSADVLKLVKIMKDLSDIKEKIIIGMGEFGFFTRVLYKKFGSLLTFCSAGENEGAPGHISPRMLYEDYDPERISSAATVYGIIGNPVMHSFSPSFHNWGYRKYKMNRMYVPFPVDDIGSFMALIREMDIKGFSVTIPHKKAIVPFLDSCDSLVTDSGACNTVQVTGSGFIGWNTDVEGFLSPLRKKIALSEIKRIAVIGAGGAASAVLMALQQFDAKIHIFNRTLSKATVLARKFHAFSHSIDSYDEMAKCDVIVQTTSVGMAPFVSRTPVPGYRFSAHQIAYDIIYVPAETLFLKEARERGCMTINGSEMLFAQGKEQFKIFTGYPYPETGA